MGRVPTESPAKDFAATGFNREGQWGLFIGIGFALMNPWVSKVLPPW